jgi:hypothetical protein
MYAEDRRVGKSERRSKDIDGENINSALQKPDFAPCDTG